MSRRAEAAAARTLCIIAMAAAQMPDLVGWPLAADATSQAIALPRPRVAFWECQACGQLKLPREFYWDEGFTKHRTQCMACDGYWKRLHTQIRNQECRALYYEKIKPNKALRKALYEGFHVHMHDLRGRSQDFCIKTWAVAHGLLPAAGGDNGADDRLPAAGVVMLAGGSPASGGFGRVPPGGEGPPSSSGSKRFRASIVSVTRVGIEAGGGVSVKTRTEVI